MIDKMSRRFMTNAVQHRWKAKFMGRNRKPSRPGTSLDAFEQRAFAAIQAGGTDEVWEQSWKGKTRYMRAIRIRTTDCLSCHPTGPGFAIKTNGIGGYVSIELTPN